MMIKQQGRFIDAAMFPDIRRIFRCLINRRLIDESTAQAQAYRPCAVRLNPVAVISVDPRTSAQSPLTDLTQYACSQTLPMAWPRGAVAGAQHDRCRDGGAHGGQRQITIRAGSQEPFARWLHFAMSAQGYDPCGFRIIVRVQERSSGLLLPSGPFRDQNGTKLGFPLKPAKLRQETYP
jgi:hypothetical protein